jgi:hypothetical protein
VLAMPPSKYAIPSRLTLDEAALSIAAPPSGFLREIFELQGALLREARPTPLVMLDPYGSQLQSARRFAHVLLSASGTDVVGPSGTFRLKLSDLPPAAAQAWRKPARLGELMESLTTRPCWFAQLSVPAAPLPLLESWCGSSGALEWRFGARVSTGVGAWAAWSRINLSICLACRRRWTLSLFELLSGMLAIGRSTWTATLEDLRCLVGGWNGWPDWQPIAPHLRKAVLELNAVSPFVVRYRPMAIKSFCAGVRFEMAPQAFWGRRDAPHPLR